MKRIFTFVTILLMSLLLTACGWTESIFGGDDNSIPPTELEDITESAKIHSVWSKDIGVGLDDAFVDLQPAIIGSDIIGVDREGQVTSLSLETGDINWQIELEMTITGGVGSGNGIIIVGNSRGEIIVLDVNNGTLLWKKELSSVMLSVPLIKDGILVVRTGDGRIFGLNTENGAQIWVYDRGVPVLTLRGNSSPLMGGRELVFSGFDSGKVVALGVQHGRVLWEANATLAKGRSDLERLVDIDGTMLLVGRVLYVVTYQGNIVALDALEGKILWSKEMSSYAGLSVDKGSVYITDSDSNIWSLDRISGKMLWKQDKLAYRKLTAPVIVGNMVVMGDYEGYIHIISQLDGSLIGRNKINSDGFHIQPQVDADTVYIYGNGGTLSALKIQ
ncbi:MAG: outer membrane protein assembly factor BamB [Gammaproteobacteria bacterium]|nr:outer membrane protein assembly factor BamB [Gammaproteobacteria bacterium]